MNKIIFSLLIFLSVSFTYAADNPYARDEEKEEDRQFVSVEKAKEIEAQEEYLKEKRDRADYMRNKESAQYFKIRQMWKKKGTEDSTVADEAFEEQQRQIYEQEQREIQNRINQGLIR